MSNEQVGNPDSTDQDAQPPGNGITTPLDGAPLEPTDDDPDSDTATADPPE